MSFFNNLLLRFGLADPKVERAPSRVLLLDDDTRKHKWFKKRLAGVEVEIAETVEQAKDLLTDNSYDAIFLAHDPLPQHY